VFVTCAHSQITYLPVQTNGLVDLQQLEAAIRPDTAIVSVMAVNNEIGVVQPVKVSLNCEYSSGYLNYAR
jgi:cysteine sulfinate desulfinase/cysteine desulfurase-like protein